MTLLILASASSYTDDKALLSLEFGAGMFNNTFSPSVTLDAMFFPSSKAIEYELEEELDVYNKNLEAIMDEGKTNPDYLFSSYEGIVAREKKNMDPFITRSMYRTEGLKEAMDTYQDASIYDVDEARKASAMDTISSFNPSLSEESVDKMAQYQLMSLDGFEKPEFTRTYIAYTDLEYARVRENIRQSNPTLAEEAIDDMALAQIEAYLWDRTVKDEKKTLENLMAVIEKRNPGLEEASATGMAEEVLRIVEELAKTGIVPEENYGKDFNPAPFESWDAYSSFTSTNLSALLAQEKLARTDDTEVLYNAGESLLSDMEWSILNNAQSIENTYKEATFKAPKEFKDITAFLASFSSLPYEAYSEERRSTACDIATDMTGYVRTHYSASELTNSVKAKIQQESICLLGGYEPMSIRKLNGRNTNIMGFSISVTGHGVVPGMLLPFSRSINDNTQLSGLNWGVRAGINLALRFAFTRDWALYLTLGSGIQYSSLEYTSSGEAATRTALHIGPQGGLKASYNFNDVFYLNFGAEGGFDFQVYAKDTRPGSLAPGQIYARAFFGMGLSF